MALKLWERLGRVVEDVDCVLHLGDQVYADEDFGAKYVRVGSEPAI